MLMVITGRQERQTVPAGLAGHCTSRSHPAWPHRRARCLIEQQVLTGMMRGRRSPRREVRVQGPSWSVLQRPTAARPLHELQRLPDQSQGKQLVGICGHYQLAWLAKLSSTVTSAHLPVQPGGALNQRLTHVQLRSSTTLLTQFISPQRSRP
jgi:hypothetical protein